MKVLKFVLKISFILNILGGASSSLAAAHNQSPSPTDPPSVHGMLLFGGDKIYLSHLPMFHSPHDYQVLLEVTLPESAKATYLDAKQGDPAETVYTIVPEVFTLPEVVNLGKSFQAKIFKGHFERGGVPITKDVTVDISKVIYFDKLDPEGSHPSEGNYIVFGNPSELFAAHKISAKPDFDQIIEVALNPTLLSLLENQNYIDIVIPEIDGTTPLEAHNEIEVLYALGATKVPLANLQTGQEVYLEFNDLSF